MSGVLSKKIQLLRINIGTKGVQELFFLVNNESLEVVSNACQLMMSGPFVISQ